MGSVNAIWAQPEYYQLVLIRKDKAAYRHRRRILGRHCRLITIRALRSSPDQIYVHDLRVGTITLRSPSKPAPQETTQTQNLAWCSDRTPTA